MKPYTLLSVAGLSLALCLTSCGNNREEDIPATDSSMMNMPDPEANPPVTEPDTVSVPPIDPALDTASNNNALPPK